MTGRVERLLVGEDDVSPELVRVLVQGVLGEGPPCLYVGRGQQAPLLGHAAPEADGSQAAAEDRHATILSTTVSDPFLWNF